MVELDFLRLDECSQQARATVGGSLLQVGEAGFTPDMVRRIQAFLDAAIPQFGKAAAAR